MKTQDQWVDFAERTADRYRDAKVISETVTYRTMRDSHTIGYLYLNGRVVLTDSIIGAGWHTGRSWHGHHIEDNCPCPQEACGLVDPADSDPSCNHHGFASPKTIRQTHLASECPGRTA